MTSLNSNSEFQATLSYMVKLLCGRGELGQEKELQETLAQTSGATWLDIGTLGVTRVSRLN